jgi:protein O-mannosyl-transferase
MRTKITLTDFWNWLEHRPDYQIILLLLIVTFAAFANSLNNGFVYDDHALIEFNQSLRDPNYITTIFNSSFSLDVPWMEYSNFYRPFRRMLFWIAFQIFGLNTFYWHFMSMALFSIVVSLVYLVIQQLSESRAVAVCGALLFSVHPIHSETVAWINGSVESFYASFFLGAFYLYLRAEKESSSRRHIFLLGSMILAMAALLSKETAICFPILIIAYRFITVESGLMRRALYAISAAVPYFIVVAAYFALRYFTYGRFLKGVSPLNAALISSPLVFLKYIKMLIAPFWLSSVNSITPVTNIADLRFWVATASLAAIAAFIIFRSPRRLAFACSWILITMLPVLNTSLFPEEFTIQDRYAFMPSIGFCAAIAMVLKLLFESNKVTQLRPVLGLLFALLLVVFFSLTVRQNSFWRDDLSLWSRAVAVNPDSNIANCVYGFELFNAGRKEESARHLTLLFEAKDGMTACGCAGLGDYYADRGDYDQAIYFYERAISLGEERYELLIFTKLANVYSEKGEAGKAIELLKRVTADYPEFSEARKMLDKLMKTENSRR